MTTLANIKNDLEDELEALLGEMTPHQATAATLNMTTTTTKHRRSEIFIDMHTQCMGELTRNQTSALSRTLEGRVELERRKRARAINASINDINRRLIIYSTLEDTVRRRHNVDDIRMEDERKPDESNWYHEA